MSRQMRMILCSVFNREIRALSALPEFRDVVLMSLPAECDLAEGRWEGIPDALEGCRKDGHSGCLIGGYCLTQACGELDLPPEVRTLQKAQCFEWVAGKDVIDALLKEDAVPLLPGWLKSWEALVDGRWPGSRKKAQGFFRDAGKKLVLLDTGVHPRIGDDLRAFGRFLRLPHETYHAGLDYLGLSLGRAVLGWRLDREKAAVEDRMEGLRERMAGYARLGNLLNTVTKASTEEEALAGALETVRILLSPRKVAYHPVARMDPEERAEDTPQDRILSLNADYAWTEDRTGFFLKVALDREPAGLIEVTGLADPDRRDHDLDLGLALAKVTGLALSNVRSLGALSRERERAGSAEAALVDSEEFRQSIFDNAPVGIYRMTAGGRIVYANPALARILGYPGVASLRAVNAWDLHLNPADREAWQSVLDGGQYVQTFETRLRRRDGTVIWVSDTTRSVKDGRGGGLFYDGAIEDITRRKQADAAQSRNLQFRMSMAEVSGRLLSRAPIGEMSELVLEHACRLTSSPSGFVGYIDHRTGRLVAAAMTPDADEMRQGHPEKAADGHGRQGIWGCALENKKALMTNILTLDPRFKGLPDWHLPVGRLLLVPAVMSDMLVGVLAAGNSDEGYSEWDLEAVTRLAELYALAVYRMSTEDKLREMSLEDELTGLYNRRGFLTLAEQQIRVAHRSRKVMTLLYADLDDLKTVNDTYGHEEGDAALAAFARVLREAFRESDIIARLGGDEFLVLAVDAGDNKTDALLSRLRDKIRQANARKGRPYRLSVSLGTARYDPAGSSSVQDLIALADKRMYEHKAAKRGRKDRPTADGPGSSGD